MKKLRLHVLALLAIAAATTATASSVVRITDGDALMAEFLLSDSPEVSYAGGELTVKSGDVTVAYPADKTYTCTIVDASGIADASTARVEIVADGNALVITGIRPDDTVRVYDLSGRLLVAAKADSTGAATLTLDHHGVIIVDLQDQSFKIIK